MKRSLRILGLGLAAVLVLVTVGLIYWFGYRERPIRVSEELIKPLPSSLEIVYRTEQANPAGQEETRNLHLIIASKSGDTTAGEIQRALEKHLRSKGWRLQSAAASAFSVTGDRTDGNVVLFMGPLESYLATVRDDERYFSERAVSDRIQKGIAGQKRPMLLLVLEPD